MSIDPERINNSVQLLHKKCRLRMRGEGVKRIDMVHFIKYILNNFTMILKKVEQIDN